jgi:TonB-linked SusC/RagA family outer membrane protein
MNKHSISGSKNEKISRFNTIFNKMKVTFVLLFMSIGLLYAGDSYSQKARVSIKQRKAPLENVLNEIEKQTDYLFLYNGDEVDVSRKVSVNAKEKPVSDVLQDILAGMSVNFIMEGSHIILTKSGYKSYKEETAAILTAAVNRTNVAVPGKVQEHSDFTTGMLSLQQTGKLVTGTIIDESGEPVVGATVREKGRATNGTVSDREGKFSIRTPENAVLQVSFIGYKTQEISVLEGGVGGKPLIITLLEDAMSLDEVVVVGYGTQKKVNLTGAVATVDTKALESRSVPRVTQALQGQVANLNIQLSGDGGKSYSTQNFNLRGYTGFGSLGQPLVIIDGVQGGDINKLNVNDIESISVLKDGASTAIYGSSAPYGVILINTKQGAVGKKVTIRYNNNFNRKSMISVPDMADYLEHAIMLNEGARNANRQPPFSDDMMQWYQDYKAGNAKSWRVNPNGSGSYQTIGNVSGYDFYFKPASSQQHNTSVSGSLGNTTYYVGMGYLANQGMLIGIDDIYERYNMRVSISSEVTKWLRFNFRSSFSMEDQSEGGDGADFFEEWTASDYLIPLMHTYGGLAHSEYKEVPGTYVNKDGLAGWALTVSREGAVREKQIYSPITTGEFVITPLTGWNITANYTYNNSNSRYQHHRKRLYTGVDANGTPQYQNQINGLRAVQRYNLHTVWNSFTSYEKTVKDHSFKAMAGFTQELFDDYSLILSNNYLLNNDLPSFALAYGTPNIEQGAQQLAIQGWFGRLNYNYREKYLLEVNGRYDGTSRFLKDSRWKLYPGVSAAWVVSKESFWEPLNDMANFFKLRFSYSKNGDQTPFGYYPFFPSMGTTIPNSTGYWFGNAREALGSYPGLVDPSLTWITTTNINPGIELGLLNNRLTVAYDWYSRYMDDYVGPAEPMPAFLGTSAPQKNSTAVETKGWELTLGWQDRIGEVSYGARLVLSDYNGTVKKYPNPTKTLYSWYEGQQMGEIWGYESDGLFQSDEEVASAPSQSLFHSNWHPGDVRYNDLDGDGEITWGTMTVDDPGDRRIIGNSTPHYSFGLTLNAAYKGFDAMCIFTGVGKRQNWVGDGVFWGAGGAAGLVQKIHVTDTWTPENTGGYYPKVYLYGEEGKNRQVSTRYLQSTAYARLKNMQIGYTLPQSLTQRFKCERLRFFIDGENVFTLINKRIRIMDPEQFGSGGVTSYSNYRAWSFGFDIQF